MPVIKISDMAHAMIDILAHKHGYDSKDIKIEIIGKREGEKTYELLMTDEEEENIYENDEMFCITKSPQNGFTPSKLSRYRSDESKVMDYDEVVNFLKKQF